MNNVNLREKQRVLLVELRAKLVGLHHTLPFTVYSDSNIEALLDAAPKTIDELAQIKGFPEDGVRVKDYGAAICAVFNQTDAINSIDVGPTGKISVVIKPMNAF